ncbi:MAG TPA: hypothetical protein H9866_03855 [Candidatus Tidjanibacter gallistercoris]|nr:hypothetical protein [Candidatus Tidjanibacter gallistercoris]
MKKLLLLASATVMAAMMYSCNEPTPPNTGNGGEGGGGGETEYKFTTASDAVYYGEKMGEGSGFYTFTLSDDKGNKVRIDCFGTVASNANNPRFTTGDYTAGSLEERTKRTFVTTDTATAEEGTIFWKGSDAYPIDGGTMNVTSQGGSFILTIKFTSGETKFEGAYEGSLKFEGKATVPPRKVDPNPRPVIGTMGAYYGKYNDNEATTGMFMFGMFYKGDTETGANVEALQLQGYMPLAEDNDQAYLAEGTYTITTSKDNTDAFSLVAGGIDVQNGYYGAYEYYTDAQGIITKGYIISEGTMTVTKNGDNYKIVANFKGTRSDQKSIIGTELEEINYEYEGALEPMMNYADPMSKLEESKELGAMNNKALVQVIPNATDNFTAWLYYIFGEGLTYTINDNVLDISGTGDLIMLAIWGPAQTTDNPVGEFPMSPGYGLLYEDGSAMPGNPVIGSSIDPQQGCWYTHAVKQGTTLSLDNYAGAMPDKGRIITKPAEDGTNQIVDFEFYDKNDYVISGIYEGEMEVIKATQSAAMAQAGLSYIPSFPIAPGFIVPATPFQIRFAD